MFKACSRCGKIHSTSYICPYKRAYSGDDKKLRSQYSWTQKSQEIREKANYLCEVCRDKGLYTYEGIEVHHIIKVRDDKSLLLDNNNLICLCKYHHMQADNGEIDKDYLYKLVEQRESRA